MLLLDPELMGRCMSRRPRWPPGEVDIKSFGVFRSAGMKTRAKVAAEQMSLRATTILRSLNSLKRIQGSEVQPSSRKARRHDERLVRRTQPYGSKKTSQKPGAVVCVGPVLKLEKELRGRTIVVHLRLDGGRLQSKQTSENRTMAAKTCRPEEARTAVCDPLAPGAFVGTNAGQIESTPATGAVPCAAEDNPSPQNGSGPRQSLEGNQPDARNASLENWAQTSHAGAARLLDDAQTHPQARGVGASAEGGEHSGVGAAESRGGEPDSSGHSKLRSCRSDGGQNHNSASENEQHAESGGRARVRRRLFDPPTPEELESFFAEAETSLHKSFEEKYNFDIGREAPLPGRFEWTRLQ